jgi:monofunctional biosynthetic peptidoglycan transglycosylase
VRRVVEADLSETGGVLLKLRGDGRTYQFRLRQNSRFDGIAWRAEFPTGGEWETVELNFGQFQPVFRGRQVPEAGPVVPSRIRQLGFMLADGQPGPFALEVRSIQFVENDDLPEKRNKK